MRAKYIIQFAFGLLLIALANGCVTKALWDNNNLETWNQPALNPNVRIFASKTRSDMLVVYDEYDERRDAIHTRAYWLNENEERIEQRRPPHFISTNSLFSLTPISVFPVTTNQSDFPRTPYARIEFDQQSFTLVLNDHGQAGPYNLPLYNDGKGKVEKIFLTPVAIVGDATVVGALIGYAYVESQSSGYNPSY